MVQINTVASTFEANHGISPMSTMIFIILLLAPVILGGIKSVARASEYLAPIMASVYILITIIVIVANPSGSVAVPGLDHQVCIRADPVVSGITGGLRCVGKWRTSWPFSNEAGLGTTPHAAGSATVAHPRRGLHSGIRCFH